MIESFCHFVHFFASRQAGEQQAQHIQEKSISDLAVSLSLGDRCSIRLSNTGNHGYPCTDLTLSSGDTLIFGRQARFACHDEPRIYPGTGHPGSGLTRGRTNITMRITVLGVSEPGNRRIHARRTATPRAH